MKNNPESKALDVVRNQARELIEKHYPTVEAFCWDKEINKATMSNFLGNKKDFQISTLSKIAKALGKKLIIKFD